MNVILVPIRALLTAFIFLASFSAFEAIKFASIGDLFFGNERPPFQVVAVSLGIGLAFFLVAYFFTLTWLWLGINIRRRKQMHLDALAKDCVASGGRYGLYLRSFQADGRVQLSTVPFIDIINPTKLSAWVTLAIPAYADRRELLDEAIYEAIEYSIPLVGIGRDEIYYGVTRVPTCDADWKDKFEKLANGASFIVCVPFPSTGSLWEIEWIKHHGLAKTIFVVPDESSGPDGGSYEHIWHSLRIAFRWMKQVPDYDPKGLVFTCARKNMKPKIWKWSRSSLRSSIVSLGIFLRPSCDALVVGFACLLVAGWVAVKIEQENYWYYTQQYAPVAAIALIVAVCSFSKYFISLFRSSWRPIVWGLVSRNTLP